MAIIGAHSLLYTPEADAVRDILKDVFELHHVDAGDGWLIFRLPPSEVGIHPTDGPPSHELTFMCDEIEATMAQLTEKGITFTGPPNDQGFGITATMELPGGLEVMLYEPRHLVAI